MTLQPGTELGHYQIQSKLGEGGMGEVYGTRYEAIDQIHLRKLLQFLRSRDGKQFAIARGTSSSDIILIKDFQ